MEQVILIFLWIIATLFIASLSLIVGKRYGVEYPIAAMAGLVVVSNIVASKIIAIGPFTVSAGILAYSTTFLITDALSEKWGKEEARKAVFGGFLASVFSTVIIWTAIIWPPAPFALDFSDKFKEVLGLTPRIVFASMVAYLVSQYHDVWAFHFWKEKTKGKHLWLRNNASTAVSQLIDTSIFITVAFWGIAPLAPLIAGTYGIKLLVAILDTPFLYALVFLLDRVGGKEVGLQNIKNMA